METVHVFFRVDGFGNAFGVDVGGQRQLHDEAVHVGVGVDFPNLIEQISLRNRVGKTKQRGVKPQFLAVAHLAGDVRFRRPVVADQNRHEVGNLAALGADVSDFLRDLLLEMGGNDLAVEELHKKRRKILT